MIGRAATPILVLALASSPMLAAQQNLYQRPTSVTAAITGSPTLRDGNFTGRGTSNICGEIPKIMSLTGVDTFSIEFSGTDTPGSVYSVSFGSKQLVRGVVNGSKFVLNVSVVTANGGKPPLYALDTETPAAGVSGTAMLTQKGQATTLALTGTNAAKEKITLTVTCG
jgi:hypothetical protein